MSRRTILLVMTTLMIWAVAAAFPAPAQTLFVAGDARRGLGAFMSGDGFSLTVNAIGIDQVTFGPGPSTGSSVDACATLWGPSGTLGGCGEVFLTIDPLLTSGRVRGTLPAGTGFILLNIEVVGTGGYSVSSSAYIPVPPGTSTSNSVIVTRSGPASGFFNSSIGSGTVSGGGYIWEGETLSGAAAV